jgi:hypothetical protein
MSSRSSSPNSPADDDDIIKAIENWASFSKRTVSHHEQRVTKVAQDLLHRRSGIISIALLMKKIQIDAANLLVDECLFLFTDDLFGDHDGDYTEGYIKYVPDDIGLEFISRILRYNINPDEYFKNIDLPEVWRSRLSANGIRLLQTMKFYQNLLDLPPPESPTNVQRINDHNNEQNQNSSLILHDQLENQQFQNRRFKKLLYVIFNKLRRGISQYCRSGKLGST